MCDTHQLHLIEMMGFAGSTHPAGSCGVWNLRGKDENLNADKRAKRDTPSGLPDTHVSLPLDQSLDRSSAGHPPGLAGAILLNPAPPLPLKTPPHGRCSDHDAPPKPVRKPAHTNLGRYCQLNQIDI
jgi:hypothetical protein